MVQILSFGRKFEDNEQKKKDLIRRHSQTTLTRRGSYVGGTVTGNVNGMQIFPYNSKGIPS